MSEKATGVEGEPHSNRPGAGRPASDVVARRLGESAVLIRLTTNRIYELNATGARVWELVQQGLSRDDMVGRLAGEFEISSLAIAPDVDELLQMLHVEGLTV